MSWKYPDYPELMEFKLKLNERNERQRPTAYYSGEEINVIRTAP